MALGNAPGGTPQRDWIHRLHVGDDGEFLEREIAANVEDGYEPFSHSAYWDPESAKRVVSILYRRAV